MKTAGEQGWIARTLAVGPKRNAPAELKTYDAILRFYEHDLKLTLESFRMAMEALEYAVANKPACGQAWSMLALLYADVYVLDIPGWELPLEKAFEFAATGIRLEHDNRRCKCIMDYVHLIRGEISAGRSEAEQALVLNRNSFFILDWK